MMLPIILAAAAATSAVPAAAPRMEGTWTLDVARSDLGADHPRPDSANGAP